jgi:hypothetical protein
MHKAPVPHSYEGGIFDTPYSGRAFHEGSLGAVRLQAARRPGRLRLPPKARKQLTLRDCIYAAYKDPNPARRRWRYAQCYRQHGLSGLGAIEWTPLTIAAAAGAAVLGAVYLGPRLKKLVG